MPSRKNSNEDENIFISKVLDGDSSAFCYFVHTYKDFAFKLSYSILKDQYLAEESIQEAFILAFENLKSFKQDAKFKTWFSRIIINQSLQKTKRNKREFLRLTNKLEVESNHVDDAMQIISKKERTKFITETFNRLPPREALALELFYLNEYSLVEIVEVTGWSQSKIKMLLLRGRNNFHSKLKSLLHTEVKDIL